MKAINKIKGIYYTNRSKDSKENRKRYKQKQDIEARDSNLISQTFKNKIAKKLEAAEAKSLNLDDIAYPRSSAKPTTNTGIADVINHIISKVFKLNITEIGMKPNDKTGINTKMLM